MSSPAASPATRTSLLAAVAAAVVSAAVLVPAAGGAQALAAPAAGGVEASSGTGAVFAMTNVASGNSIVSYRRAADGALTRVGTVGTRGHGIGVDLDTQGALRLSADNRFLYAANAGSDDVTVFSVDGPRLTFRQKVYAGDQPNSLTLHGDLMYVLDGSVAGNGVRGFRVGSDGRLRAIPGSMRLLSSPIAVPGQVEFSPDGKVLVVTHKTTNTSLSPAIALDTFRVGSDGLASAPRRQASAGVRPFSLAFRDAGSLVVTESFDAAPDASALSSYRLSADGALTPVSRSVKNAQTDVCWVVLTEDGRRAYVANFGSGTISSYDYDAKGVLRLRDARAASLGATSQPVDLALSADGRSLHLLLRGTGAVASFRIQPDGSLSPLGTVRGALPVADGASGLAAF